MISFGLGITKEKIWNYVVVQGDRLIVSRRLGTAALGQYHVMAVALLPSRYFGDIIDNVFYPVMARTREHPERLSEIWIGLVTNSFVFMAGVGAFMSINSNLIVSVAFGDRWSPYGVAFQILALGTGFAIVGRISDSLNRALGRVHETARRKMFNAIVFLPAMWFGTSFGLAGACSALVGVQFFNALLQFDLASRSLMLANPLRVSQIGRALVAAAAIVGVNAILFGLEYWDLIGSIQLFSISTALNVFAGILYYRPLLRLWLASSETVTP